MITIHEVTKTANGHRIDFDNGVTINVGAAFGFVVVYQSGGWNPETKASDAWCFSKHKTAAAAHKAAAAEQGTVVELDGWAPADDEPAELSPVDVLAATSDRATVARLHGADVADFVAERYPSALPLLAGGWTVDAALAHIEGTCDRELCTGEHDEPVSDPAVAALRKLGWSEDQIVAAIVAAARVDAVDNPPAHAVGCGCMTCEARRVDSATAAELDAYEAAERY